MNILLPEGEIAKFLIDKSGDELALFTIQNFMWLGFFIACAELCLRYVELSADEGSLRLALLPEDEESIMNNDSLVFYYKKNKTKSYRVSRIINLIIMQFQSSKSISMSSDVLKTSLEIESNEIDLKYTILRYILWAIPSLGFVGTVYGIALALNLAKSMKPDDPEMLPSVIGGLSVAFYTTLLSLLMSCLLVLLMNIIQAKEERTLNEEGRYCIKNLINRLYVKTK
ncbi:MAG: MotA/TolQ/ExbB proton channel family protein [Opitutales bacterium]